ncbi:MexE family multidrug efflux RND transporter periplasmic adaptor subunit [Labrys miyagiensis]|uniref:MexE family multidrug efflux RND transporter periplasmic adaptor subunit n=1 Tax=Labrys miyagiensis TaxID=346912 RepID=A0ABQ6CII3_9HYPH|nr:efflux RND transporter periplasmic adaptor subunit [Labrys miyagiensis]GLS19523.1 MexE family multidrug efflux RND transporter periplasmic adaptor subunit [Labrys miyagiensis]
MRQVTGTGRQIAWSALVVLAFLGASQPGRAQDAPPPPVTVAKPVVKDVVEYDDFIGRFEPVDQVDIRARVSGYVDKINFTDGSVVKPGDLLFTIDQRPYQAALDEAQASLESAKARVDFAQGDVARAENLRKSGNITGQIYDERAQTLATAQADVNRAQATLNRAKLDLQFTEIRAPIAGRMSRHLVSLGNLVNANDTVLSNIVSMDPINFYFDVDERSFLAYQKLSTGSLRTSNDGALNEVLVATSDENEPTHKGHLDFTDNRLDNASGTIRARAILDNKDLSLVPGLFGRIRILGSDKYKGVLVPEDAIGSDQDRRVVYVVGADNTISLQPVRVGSRVDGYRVIRVGLKGDETIVVNGLMRVRPGIKVDPKLMTLPPVAVASMAN